MTFVLPIVPFLPIPTPAPNREPEDKPARHGGVIHLYSSESGVRKIVATIDLGE